MHCITAKKEKWLLVISYPLGTKKSAALTVKQKVVTGWQNHKSQTDKESDGLC